MSRNLWSKMGRVAFTVVQVGCLAHCINSYVGGIVYCSGPSMEPSIRSMDIVLTEQFSVRRQTLHKGDVVISVSPENPRSFICKRLVAMEGDHIYNELENSFHYIPKGHVWLEGDNKHNSSDSRYYGPVPYGLLKGRVCFKIWPPLNIGRIPYSDYID